MNVIVEQIGIASRKETASGSTGNGNHENAEEVFVTDNIHSLDLDPILPDNMIYIDNSDSIQSDAAFNTKFNNILDGSHFNRNTGLYTFYFVVVISAESAEKISWMVDELGSII